MPGQNDTTRRILEMTDALKAGIPEVEPIPEGDDPAQKVMALALMRAGGEAPEPSQATVLLATGLVAILREHFHLVPRE